MTDRTADDKQIKVTDKRMFTPDGELREDFKELGAAGGARSATPSSSPSTPSSTSTSPSKSAPAPSPTSRGPQGAAPASAGAPQGPDARSAQGAEPVVGPDGRLPVSPSAGQTSSADYPSGAQFEDLVALLAQTTVTFLQQASRPQGRTESLEQAQLYLDLLGILDDKTAGNLAPGEKAMLQDALRQLRLAFAQRG